MYTSTALVYFFFNYCFFFVGLAPLLSFICIMLQMLIAHAVQTISAYFPVVLSTAVDPTPILPLIIVSYVLHTVIIRDIDQSVKTSSYP